MRRPPAVTCTENEETVKNTKRTYMSRSRHNMARARLLYDTWPGRETKLSLRICVRSEAELAARAVAALGLGFALAMEGVAAAAAVEAGAGRRVPGI